jgi:hypothetical protein
MVLINLDEQQVMKLDLSTLGGDVTTVLEEIYNQLCDLESGDDSKWLEFIKFQQKCFGVPAADTEAFLRTSQEWFRPRGEATAEFERASRAWFTPNCNDGQDFESVSNAWFRREASN